MAQLTVLNNQRPDGANAPGRVSGAGQLADPEREAIAGGLAELLAGGAGQVRFGRHDRLLYSTDASLYQVEPIGVVVPASVDEAARVVRFCGERGIAMLPRGGGTSLAGQCTNRAVVIDLSANCRGIKSIDAGAKECTVEPGITIDELNDALGRAKTGLFFAPDPATIRQCAIGGCIGNNAAGARSIRYGRTSENLSAVEVMLATGERLTLGPNAGKTDATARRLAEGVIEIVRTNARLIRERFPRTIRRNAGYGLDMVLDQVEAGATAETLDLSKLLCGSEGTLAVTLGATLKLHPTPKSKGLAVLSFASLEEAIEAVQPILRTNPTAVELLDDVVLDAARGNAEARRYIELLPKLANSSDAAAVLYVEYFAFNSADELRESFARLRGAVRNAPTAEYTDTGAMMNAWALRRAGEPLLHGLPGARKPVTFVEDNAVPVERLAEFVREFKKIVARHGTRAAYWAHASVGVLHIRPMIDLHDAADRQRMREIAVEVADLARSVGGIMSGEHGDGRVRGPLLERFFGPELMGAFRQVKQLFDPQNLLNPGNIVAPGPVESITADLRVDRKAHVPPKISTYFNYSDSEGFGHAVEQCNGAGVCRKKAGAGGTMCPSYHATMDERHSTRGRGNALRLAITGQFGGLPGAEDAPNWNDPETIKTLDLCLSCKACKSECPSNVDISRLKAEYTAQRYKHLGRVPLPAYATGHVRILNSLGAAAPRLANWFASTRPVRAIINRAMKMHSKRTLPPFSKSLYRAARSLAPTSDISQSRRGDRHPTSDIVLFTDCFTTYNESHVGLAAMRVLRALGYNVMLSGSHCCGRSMISVGMLGRAIENIDIAVERLRPVIDDPNVKALIVCEPSCLSAIKDDWLMLNCRTSLDMRKRLAAKAMLPEEFVDRFWDKHPTPPPSPSSTSDILLHAHCHQKSLWGADTSANLLRRLAGDRLRVLDTGCCGMAGSFGFDADKFDLSMAIGELKLLPAIRAAAPDAIIAAAGTSCRHQIHDGCGRRALHPIEVAEMLMVPART